MFLFDFLHNVWYGSSTFPNFYQQTRNNNYYSLTSPSIPAFCVCVRARAQSITDEDRHIVQPSHNTPPKKEFLHSKASLIAYIISCMIQNKTKPAVFVTTNH